MTFLPSNNLFPYSQVVRKIKKKKPEKLKAVKTTHYITKAQSDTTLFDNFFFALIYLYENQKKRKSMNLQREKIID